MTEQVKLVLKPSNKYGYFAYRGECPECFEEIEDVIGETKCEGCGTVLNCGFEIQLPKE